MKETMEDFSPKKLFHLLDKNKNLKIEAEETLNFDKLNSSLFLNHSEFANLKAFSYPEWIKSNTASKMREALANTKLYKYSLANEKVHFIMATSNVAYFRTQLKEAKEMNYKFVAINDNKDGSKRCQQAEEELLEFYVHKFPTKSSFELS